MVIKVHNHGLSVSQVKELQRIIDDYAVRGFYILLLGDFNITAHGRYYIGKSFCKSDAPVTIHAAYQSILSQQIFDKFIETYHPAIDRGRY